MAEPDSQKSGAEILVAGLKELHVDTIFAITGAGNLAIIDALVRDGGISVIYSHHEQAAVMEAQGYSRLSNRLGVALVTTGGGTSNAVTGMLSAHLDSIPVLLISGNESSFHCTNTHNLRAYGVQGFDSCAVLEPIVKASIRVHQVEDVLSILHKSAQTSLSNRRGPSHIDFPMDLQRKRIDVYKVDKFKNDEPNQKVLNEEVLNLLVQDISNSKSPLFYFGNGIRDEKSIEIANSVIKKSGIPYVVSWSAIDIFPESESLNIGRVGIYGDRHANILIQKSDLIIAIGTRLAIPQTGYNRGDFGRNAVKWVIDIDSTECAKFEGLDWNTINMDAQLVLQHLNQCDLIKTELNSWRNECKEVKKTLPRKLQMGQGPTSPDSQIHSGEVISFLNETLSQDAVVVTDVGAALLSGHFLYEQIGNRRFFTSQGLGEMGFGLPGSIGAYFADKSRQVVCLNTDGALMFNLQELQVVKEHRIPLKLFVFNNFGYSMIRISQDNLFDGRVAGSTIESGVSFPDFDRIADAFNLRYSRINNIGDLSKATLALNSSEPELIEVIMDPEQKYLPRLATNKLSDGSFISSPIEDLDPMIELYKLEEFLGYRAHDDSYKARGLQ